MATKAEIEAKRARDLALKQLDKSQEAKIIALREALRVQNVPSSEIASIIKQEEAANKAEVTALRSTMAAGGEPNIVSKLSTPVPGNTAALVDDTLKQATALYDKLGFQEISDVKADGSYSGVPMSDLVKVVLNTDPATGKLTKGSDKTLLSDQSFKLYNSAFENIGKPRTAEEVGATTPLGTDANGNQLFTKKIAVNTQRRGYEILKQNPDGTLSAIGYTASTLPPQDDGNFWTSDLGKAVMIGASLAGGWALAPVSAGGLGGAAAIGGSLGTSAAVGGAIGGGLLGGTLAGISGGNVLTGAALGALGGYGAGGGFEGIGNTLTQTFSDITGVPVENIKSVFTGNTGSSLTNQIFDDGSVLVTDAAGQIVGGLDAAGQAFGNLAVQVADDGSRLLTDAGGRIVGGVDTAGQFFNGQNAVSTVGGTDIVSAIENQYAGTGGMLGGTPSVNFGGGLGTTGAAATGATAAGTGAATTAGTGGALTGAANTIRDLLKPSDLGNLLGGVLGGAAGLYGANVDKQALAQQAAALQAAAAKQAPNYQFQPIGITTRFGSTTTPQYDAQGRLTGFGYTPTADIAEQRDRLLSLSSEALPTTTNVEQATADYLRGLEALQRPADEQNLANLTSRLQATGRGGLGFGATTGAGGSTALAATNPELAAYYNALAQRQAQQALTAQDVAQQRLTRQLDLSKGLFGQASTLETAAQQPLTMGTSLGQLTTAGSTNAANAQLQAAQTAALLRAQGELGQNRATTGALTGLAPAAGSILGNVLGNILL